MSTGACNLTMTTVLLVFGAWDPMVSRCCNVSYKASLIDFGEKKRFVTLHMGQVVPRKKIEAKIGKYFKILPTLYSKRNPFVFSNQYTMKDTSLSGCCREDGRLLRVY